MHSLSEILGVGILTHACEKRLNSAQNLPFGGKSSGCRKGDACPGNVVWEASPSHLQGAGVGGELRVAPVDLPRITRAAMSLSPVGVVGPVWGCRGKQVNSRGFLEWDPHCGLTGVPVTCWDALRCSAGVGHRRGRHQPAGCGRLGGGWGLGARTPGSVPCGRSLALQERPLPRFPHLSSESQWRVRWGDASNLRTWSALRGGAGEEGRSLAILEQCSDTRSGVDMGTFSSPACPLPPPTPRGASRWPHCEHR